MFFFVPRAAQLAGRRTVMEGSLCCCPRCCSGLLVPAGVCVASPGAAAARSNAGEVMSDLLLDDGRPTVILRCWSLGLGHWVPQRILVIAQVKSPCLLPLALSLLCGECLLFGGDTVAEFLCETVHIFFGVVRAAADQRLKVKFPSFKKSGVLVTPAVLQYDFGGFFQGGPVASCGRSGAGDTTSFGGHT